MKRYVVLFKKFSESQRSLIMCDETVEASHYDVNDCGVLTFYRREKVDDGSSIYELIYPIWSLPPGAWLDVVIAPEQSSLVQP